MIETIQDDIITQLQKITTAASVGVWQGDIEDLLKSPQRLPALNVIYHGADFDEKKVIGTNRADHQMDFLIVLVSRNLKSREAGASEAYTIIEAVRNYLIGHQISRRGGVIHTRLVDDRVLLTGDAVLVATGALHLPA